MPSRSPKMKRRILGFQRRVWWPKCTPASSSSRMPTSVAMGSFQSCGGTARPAPRGPGRDWLAGQDPRALRAGSGTVGACQSRRRDAASARRSGVRRRRRRLRPRAPRLPGRRGRSARDPRGRARARPRGGHGQADAPAAQRRARRGPGRAAPRDAGADGSPVEPLAAMRAKVPRAIAGTAEAIPLADASVDAATIADAWHWFDWARAGDELARVIRPGGVAAILWQSLWEDGRPERSGALGDTLRPLRVEHRAFPQGGPPRLTE